MSRSVNRVTLIGNVGGDPEVRSTQGGKNVANFSLATTRRWKDSSDREQESTQWHRIVVWAGLADVVDQYVRKGDKLYIEGRLEYRKWQDKDGNDRVTTEVNAQELVMLGSPRGSGDKGAKGARGRDDDGPRDGDREDYGPGDEPGGEYEGPDDEPAPRGQSQRSTQKRGSKQSRGRGR